jgi:hypothetical protein
MAREVERYHIVPSRGPQKRGARQKARYSISIWLDAQKA